MLAEERFAVILEVLQRRRAATVAEPPRRWKLRSPPSGAT